MQRGGAGGRRTWGRFLALCATKSETLAGAVGVSGDTSCADHNIAWRVRNNRGLDHLASASGGTGIGAKGYGHPMCANTTNNYQTLPAVSQ